MTAQETRDATTPVIGEVPPDAVYLARAQRAWLALVGDIPVGVLALASIHVIDGERTASALLRMVYVDHSHRGSGVATELVETARAAMSPLVVQYDGMTSDAGLSFVKTQRIPQCPCADCVTKPFSDVAACTIGNKELARAVDAWESGNRQLLSAAASAARTETNLL